MNREKTGFGTTGGFSVEHYTYLTGREARELQTTFMSNVEITVNQATKEQRTSVKGDAVMQVQDKAMRMLIVSIKKGETLTTLDDLPVTDYNEIVRALEPMVQPAIGNDFLAKPSTPANA